MDAQYASRKQQLLAECQVAPEIFHEGSSTANRGEARL